MRSAIDDEGRQTHIMGVVGHQTGQCHTLIYMKMLGYVICASLDKLTQATIIRCCLLSIVS